MAREREVIAPLTGTEPAEVRAAGGLVVRSGSAGAEVAVVHRPRYDDWSLPKGKLDAGESFAEAALREVEEETGLRCELGNELEPVCYLDRKGRSKLVRYFRMTPMEGRFQPSSEVDEARWLALADAVDRLDYEHDRALVRTLIKQTSS